VGFFLLPLVQAENADHEQSIERTIALKKKRAREWPPEFRSLYYDFGLKQLQGQLETIRRFGRLPHRNAILKRHSTPDELEYLARGDFVHQRPIVTG
jgi:uncharacterized protein (DUF924 family)